MDVDKIEKKADKIISEAEEIKEELEEEPKEATTRGDPIVELF